MTDFAHFTYVEFYRFKGFFQYSLNLQQFNILVGPNNCGKSTVLGAFRILAEGMRKAFAKKPTSVEGPDGIDLGYQVDLSEIPIATENVFFDYNDSEPALVTFKLSNGNELILFFKEIRTCNLICRTKEGSVRSVSNFKKVFNAPIGFVPILGPVEHNEALYLKEAARLALLTHRAARNFRNIWYHYPESFDEFRTLVQSTWPGMDISPPELDYTHSPSRLHMFCPEERIPREIYWAGFGFQVWCQMLTYIIRGKNSSIFLIDEPDIYLHSDLQRQLLVILRSLGPDILIATHSTEIISEAEPDELIIINKRLRSARRIRQSGELQLVFNMLGSNLNPVLTKLAKTKRVLFIEGKDFKVLSQFARKLGNDRIANSMDFVVVSLDGFNTEKIDNFFQGIKTALGTEVIAAAIFNRGYRTNAECTDVQQKLSSYCHFIRIHTGNDIENFLIQPVVLTRAIQIRLAEKIKRTGENIVCYEENTSDILKEITSGMRHKVLAGYIEKASSTAVADETITKKFMNKYEQDWENIEQRLKMIPGKDTLVALNSYLQQHYGINVTSTLIINSFKREEINPEIMDLISEFDVFTKF